MRSLTPRVSRATALRIIRGIESNPRTYADVILRRRVDPRWQELQRAYAALPRAWSAPGDPDYDFN